MNKRLKEIQDKLKDIKPKAWRHYESLRYYPYKMGLTRPMTFTEKCWIDDNVKSGWSIDHTCSPHNISFENKDEMLLMKLKHPDPSLFCQPHVIL